MRLNKWLIGLIFSSKVWAINVQALPEAKVVKWNTGENKVLIYIAIHNTNRMDSSIHQAISKAFTEENPNFYVMQGFSSEDEGISPKRLQEKSQLVCSNSQGCGENLFGAYLATQRNIPFLGIEPPQDIYIEPLERRGYSFEDLVFFKVCQQIPFFHRDGDFENNKIRLTPENFEEFITSFIQTNISGWLKRDIKLTSKDFLKWWEKSFHKPYEFSKDLLWPDGTIITEAIDTDEALITQKISSCISKIKTDYMLDKIILSLSDYPKVIVVTGAYYIQFHYHELTKKFGKPVFEQRLESPFKQSEP